jgi:hypothetical protein
LLSANMENTSKKKLTFIRIVHFFDDGNNLYFFVHGRRGISILYASIFYFKLKPMLTRRKKYLLSIGK